MNNSNVTVSTGADFDGWLKLAAEVESLFGPMVTEPGFLTALTQKIAEGQAFCVRQGDNLSGTPLLGGVVISREENEIIWLAVSASARGNGLGDRLLSCALESLDRTRPVSVVTFDNSVEAGLPAKRLYQKYGFADHQPQGVNLAGIPIVLMVRE
jgi:ribosomal protein S18 acetylase RimI-like enzyme